MAMTGNSKHLLFAAKNDDRLVGIYSYTTLGSGKPQPGGVRTPSLLRAALLDLGPCSAVAVHVDHDVVAEELALDELGSHRPR